MASRVPMVTFNNGRKFPVFGLGTWKSQPGQVERAVSEAIEMGYRHFDCAHVYGNEREVGAALGAQLQKGSVKREDLFITSKLWHTFHRPDLVLPALRQTLADLNLDYVDLYLIHGPMGYQEGGPLFPKDGDRILHSDVDFVDTWPEMEKAANLGLAKSIGVSNFNSKQLQRVLDIASIPPAVNQVECHPYLNQQKLLDFCEARGVKLTAYSPLGSPDRPWAKPEDPQLLEDPKLREVATRCSKTPAQVLLRYQVQRGIITIPKSVTKSRIQENFDIFDFQLSAEDMKYLSTLDVGGRFCHAKWLADHKHYPYNIQF